MIKDLVDYKNVVYKIIGAAMEVHSELNYGLLEAVYQEALSLELESRGINNKREEEISIYYKGALLQKKYKMDIIVDDVIVELKSASKITSAHRAQLCNYLRLSKKRIGILINFGSKSLQGERWVFNRDTNECILVDKNMTPVSLDYDPFDERDQYIINE